MCFFSQEAAQASFSKALPSGLWHEGPEELGDLRFPLLPASPSPVAEGRGGVTSPGFLAPVRTVRVLSTVSLAGLPSFPVVPLPHPACFFWACLLISHSYTNSCLWVGRSRSVTPSTLIIHVDVSWLPNFSDSILIICLNNPS